MQYIQYKHVSRVLNDEYPIRFYAIQDEATTAGN